MNICLRNLSDDQYVNIRDHIQNVTSGWNFTVRKTTGFRPFEIMTGTTPVTLGDTAVLGTPSNGDLDIQQIRESLKAFAETARAHADFVRK